jgi:uncharacterized protein
MKIVRIAAVAVLVLAAAALGGVGLPAAAQSQDVPAENRIAVNGTGAVAAVPDRAELLFGVVSQAQTARAALAANATEARRVVDALRRAGVAAADIQTQQVSLAPRFAEGSERIVGYTAQTSVSARVRELERAATVIDAAVAAGANTVAGPSLARSDAAELYRNALRAAVADARTKGQALAAAAGGRLGEIVAVTEAGSSPVADTAVESARAGAAPPIEPGTQRIEATVTVSFALL